MPTRTQTPTRTPMPTRTRMATSRRSKEIARDCTRRRPRATSLRNGRFHLTFINFIDIDIVGTVHLNGAKRE